LAKKPTFSQYRTSCAVDTDCQPVALLDYPQNPADCPVCSCPNTAIATSDVAKFEEEARAARSHCLVAAASPRECGALCAKADAFCDAGTCALKK
jgi:hypothetical protein